MSLLSAQQVAQQAAFWEVRHSEAQPLARFGGNNGEQASARQPSPAPCVGVPPPSAWISYSRHWHQPLASPPAGLL